MILAEVLLDDPNDLLTLELDMEPDQVEDIVTCENPRWYIKQYGRDAFFSIPKDKYIISWVVPEEQPEDIDE